jgi:hypothetical protein
MNRVYCTQKAEILVNEQDILYSTQKTAEIYSTQQAEILVNEKQESRL